MPLPMGRTGPGLYGKAPVFRGLGTQSCFSVAAELHLGQAGTSSPKTRSSNLLPQAVQTKSYMGMVFLLNRYRTVAVAALYRNKTALLYAHAFGARARYACAFRRRARAGGGLPWGLPTCFVCIYKYIYGQGKGGVLPPTAVQQSVVKAALTGSRPFGGTYEENSCACWRLC